MTDPEVLLWPHEPNVELQEDAQALVESLREMMKSAVEGNQPSLDSVARSLGVEVVARKLTHPRLAWTWFLPQRPLIEISEHLEPDVREAVLAHEICHVMLGPTELHDRLTERVCNWGASRMLRLIADA